MFVPLAIQSYAFILALFQMHGIALANPGLTPADPNPNPSLNGFPSLSLLQHKLNASFKEAKKRVMPHGASDIIVIRNSSDGTLRSSPLLVHFGNGFIPSKRKGLLGQRVEMTVNGKKLRRVPLMIRKNRVVVQSKKLIMKSLEGILMEVNKRHTAQFSAIDWKGRTVVLRCSIYYWDINAKLVISDIDGTVTKSDVWGMMLGNAWVQPDVRTLYRNIKRNGYRIVYLSARPASTGSLTRRFLKNLKLPLGPIVLSPEQLGKALKTSVTDPERIKVRAMQQIKKLFNRSSGQLSNSSSAVQKVELNPFHAAFGNQATDQFAYEMVSIPITFMVDQQGNVTISRGKKPREENRSYRHIIEHLNEYFPPMK